MPGERPLPIGGWVPGPAGDDTPTDAYGGGTTPDSYGGPDPYAGPDAYTGPDEYAREYRDSYPRYSGSSPSSWDGAPADDIVDPQLPEPWDAFAPAAAGIPDEAVPRARRRRQEPGRRRRLVTPRIAIAGIAVGVLLVSAGVSARNLLSGPDGDEAQPPPVPPDGLATTPDTSGDLGTATPTPGPSAPASEPPAVTEVSFEAEAAGVGSHGQVVSVDGASGGDAVKLTGNPAGTFVQFSGIEVGAAGTYWLRIAYFAEQDRTGAVVVNGDQDTAQAVSFPSRVESGTVGEVVLEVPLTADGNDILVSSTGGPPLFVDGITITATG